jgi:hypothetical protein
MGIVAWEWQTAGGGRIGTVALAVLVLYFCVDFSARLGQFDYVMRDLGIPTAAALLVWGLGTVCLARTRARPRGAEQTFDLPPDMILAGTHE